jgi:hypothetical protein
MTTTTKITDAKLSKEARTLYVGVMKPIYADVKAGRDTIEHFRSCQADCVAYLVELFGASVWA